MSLLYSPLTFSAASFTRPPITTNLYVPSPSFSVSISTVISVPSIPDTTNPSSPTAILLCVPLFVFIMYTFVSSFPTPSLIVIL